MGSPLRCTTSESVNSVPQTGDAGIRAPCDEQDLLANADLGRSTSEAFHSVADGIKGHGTNRHQSFFSFESAEVSIRYIRMDRKIYGLSLPKTLTQASGADLPGVEIMIAESVRARVQIDPRGRRPDPCTAGRGCAVYAARPYRWWSPPRCGVATTAPGPSSTGRASGALPSRLMWQRAPL